MHRPPRQLYTVAFPELSPEAASFVERVRSEHGGDQPSYLAAHFTLVFGSGLLGEDEYARHVAAVAATQSPIEFTCRCATLGVDGERGKAHVFLVPDEGFAAITRLHDALYSGPLAAAERLDLPYIPHMTVGTMDDSRRAKKVCLQINEAGVCVPGRLTALVVGALGPQGFEVRSRHALDFGHPAEP